MTMYDNQARQAQRTGQRVLAALSAGRMKANAVATARHRALVSQVISLAAAEVLSGKRSYGRAGRITRALSGRVTERHISRILRKEFRTASSARPTFSGTVLKTVKGASYEKTLR